MLVAQWDLHWNSRVWTPHCQALVHHYQVWTPRCQRQGTLGRGRRADEGPQTRSGEGHQVSCLGSHYLFYIFSSNLIFPPHIFNFQLINWALKNMNVLSWKPGWSRRCSGWKQGGGRSSAKNGGGKIVSGKKLGWKISTDWRLEWLSPLWRPLCISSLEDWWISRGWNRVKWISPG